MPDKPWKAHERRTAKRIGGIRAPLSGSASRHTSGDIIHPTLYIECKYRKSFAILSAMHQVEAKAKSERKIPVLVLQERGAKRAYAVIDIGDLTVAFSPLKNMVTEAIITASGIYASQSETSIQTPLAPPRDQPKKQRKHKSHRR